MSSADYIPREELGHLLASLMPANRLALEVSLSTGMRIGDVLSIRTDELKQRMTVKEHKTGKSRRVYIPSALYDRLVSQAGPNYVFEGRRRKYKPPAPRTVSAVYKDLRRAAKLWRLPEGLHLSPHTARKVYAVCEYQRSGSLRAVQQLLCHTNEAVTMLYAMADVLTARRLGKASGIGRKRRK